MEIRSFWNSYSELRITNQDQQVRQSIASLHVGDWHINGRIARVTSHGMRSAGVHSLESVDSMNEALHEFWKTGAVAGNFDDVAMLCRENGGCVNPLISGSPTCPSEFAVPYGVEPLIGYHLAEAFNSTQSWPNRNFSTGVAASLSVSSRNLSALCATLVRLLTLLMPCKIFVALPLCLLIRIATPSHGAQLSCYWNRLLPASSTSSIPPTSSITTAS